MQLNTDLEFKGKIGQTRPLTKVLSNFGDEEELITPGAQFSQGN